MLNSEDSTAIINKVWRIINYRKNIYKSRCRKDERGWFTRQIEHSKQEDCYV